MAKKFDQVATMQDVYEYARDSYLAARKQGCIVPAGPNKGLSCYCPQSAPQYKNLTDKIKADMAGMAPAAVPAAVDAYKKAILAINAACRKEAGWVKPPPNVVPTPAPPPPENGNGLPPQKAGFPWWIVVLLGGGALVYYLATKKTTPSQRKARRRVRRKRRAARRRKR